MVLVCFARCNSPCLDRRFAYQKLIKLLLDNETGFAESLFGNLNFPRELLMDYICMLGSFIGYSFTVQGVTASEMR